MALLVVPNCCFFFDLRTGSLIIGYMKLFINVFMLVVDVVQVTILFNSEERVEEFERETGLQASYSVGFFEGLMAILNLLFVIAFLVGMYKYQRNLVGIYIVYTLVNIAIAIIVLMYSIIVFPTTVGVLTRLFNLALNIYFVIVIRSYYLIMPTQPPPPVPYNIAGPPPVPYQGQPQNFTMMPPNAGPQPQLAPLSGGSPTGRLPSPAQGQGSPPTSGPRSANTPTSRPNTPTSLKPNTSA